MRSVVIIFTGLLMAGHALRPPPAVGQGATATVTTPSGDVTILADRLEEITADNLIIATGNVEITKGTARLLADRGEINSATGARAAFWVESIPLLPVFPFFSAAIRRERQTGFLFPRFGSSSFKGAFLELPFYWAIADNVDATVTLSEYTKRGTGGSAEARYVLSDT